MKVHRGFLIFILIIVNIKTINCYYSNFSTIKSEYNCTTNIILEIMKTHFPCNTLVNVLSSSDEINRILLSLNNDICFNVIVRSVYNIDDWHFVTDIYIIVSEDIYELSTRIFELSYDFYWAPEARFIVQVLNVVNLRPIFEIFIKYNIYNVILLVCIDEVTEVFTYYPFADANCGKDFGEVANLGKVTAIEKYFSNKQPNRMKNCTVKVVMQETIPYVNLGTSHHDTYDKHMEGIDQYVLNIMAKIEDVTLDYIVPSTETSTLGFVLPNGTVTDQLAYLQNGSADIAIGGYILIENQAEHFDYIWGYKYASYYLFTPAKSNDNWKDIYEEFSLTTWILIISAYWLIVAVCLMVLQLPPAIKHSRLNIMLVLWGFYLWNCNKRILQIKRLRLILIWWIWYTFFVVNFYTSYLYSLIASYNQKPANIDENNLNSSKLKPCISSNVRASYLYSHNISFPENVDLPACKHSGSALKAVAENDNLFTIQRHYHYLANEFKFYDDNHYRKLDLKRIGNTMNVVMYTNRGFPLQNQMKLHGTRIFETGIVDKHLEILIHTNKTVSKKAVTKYSKLSMPDLRISFWILLLGIIISLLCFLLEFVINKYNYFFVKIIENISCVHFKKRNRN